MNISAFEEDGVAEYDRVSSETTFFSAARAHSVRSDPCMPCLNAMFDIFQWLFSFLSTLVVPVCRQFAVLSLHEQTRMLL